MSITYHKQETNFTCSAACMRMILASFGIKKSEKSLAKLLKTNRIRGALHKDFPTVLENYKLNYIVKRNASFDDIKQLHKEEYKIILSYYAFNGKIPHSAILKNINSRFIYLIDPWFGPNHKYSLKKFKKLWVSDKRFEKEKRWLMAVKK
ncbi:MAG: cysteine peptidase family C39 domain-containing protein [archaeon]|nr:cysteine peptidase family C39 domain-containing protein [archaeon]